MRYTVFILFLYLLFFNVGIVFPAIVPVTPDDNLQILINNTEAGDTVLLNEGEYQQVITISEHPITLAGWYLLSGNGNQISATRWNLTAGETSIVIDSLIEGNTHISGISFVGLGSSGQYATALRCSTSSVRISSCHFNDCSNLPGGAAIYGYYSIINANNCFFFRNQSQGGSAIRAKSCEYVNIINNLFLENSATGPFGGSVLCSNNDVEIDTRCLIVNNVFEKNKASNGGAVYISSIDTVLIRDNRFVENADTNLVQGSFGGALMLGPFIEQCVINNNQFIHNLATIQGGAINLSSASIVSDNLFVRNTSSSSGAIATEIVNNHRDFTVHIMSNAFIANFQTEFWPSWYGTFRVAPGTGIILEQNDFYDNQAYAIGYEPGYNGRIESTNNYWGDPSGPFHEIQNPEGLGDTVMVNSDILPFASEPFTPYRRPFPFDLISPEHGTVPITDSLVFTWQSTNDPEPGDFISAYLIEVADDSLFRENLVQFETGHDTLISLDSESLPNRFWWRAVALDTLGLRRISNEVRLLWMTEVANDVNRGNRPLENRLHPPWPNPFNESLCIEVEIKKMDQVFIQIYDVQGRQIISLYQGNLAAGTHLFQWKADGVASGVFFIHFSTRNNSQVYKLLHLE